jgi:4-amino-4-deoxy-L-arabinose transferase-like glycosyltransferase
MNRSWVRTALVLSVFAAAFIALAVASYTRESATWDEPQHLIAGYTALKFHDYRTDPEHPRFLRMWAALPLLAQRNIKMDVSVIDKVDPITWVHTAQFDFCHGFLYLLNDADRLLYPARFMIVLLGVLLGILLFCWTRELLGFLPAVMALVFYTLEPNLLAHARLVTTDFGVVCFVFGTMYFLWRTARALSLANACGLIGFFTLAQISKFSAVLLGPIVLVCLVVRVCLPRPWPMKLLQRTDLTNTGRKTLAAAAILVALVVVTWAAVWATYGFRFLPSASPTWKMDFRDEPMVSTRVPTLSRVVTWADEHRLLPNAYLEGFLLGQAKARVRSGFLAGQYSLTGWWYFFPFAFLIKTPVSIIALFLGGLTLCAARPRRFLQDNLYIALPIVGFLGPAMIAKLNVGLRHILPVYPFVLLVATQAAAELWNTNRRPLRVLLGGLYLLALGEVGSVYPHYLAFFNRLVGGPRNGSEYLVDSNLDWGQDLKGLKAWMDKNNVSHINLGYFGTADPAYYKINCTYLPGGPFFDEDRVGLPRLPGYVAVSATNLRGVYFSQAWRYFYAPLLKIKPVATIGYSIYVYPVQRPWWSAQP